METKIRKLITENIDPCLICGTTTSKLHLQVNACYACAAFFRRSVNIHQNYKCQSYTKNCNLQIKKIGKPLCRYCRYQKCYETGMQINNKGNPKKLDDMIAEKLSNESNINMDSIHETINKIFKKERTAEKEFSQVLMNFLEITKPKKQLISVINDDIRIRFVEKVFTESSKMLSAFSCFAKLRYNEKVLIHQHVWQIYHLFALCYHACEQFGKDINDMRLPIDNYQYLDFDSFINKWEKNPGFALWLKPLSDKIRKFLKSFKKLNITFYELCYSLEIVLWSVQELPGISEKLLQLANQKTQEISNDLHFYYLNTQRIPNYSFRQAKIFLLINLAESIIRDKSQMVSAKSVFDFGNTQFGYCQFETDYFNYLRSNK